MRRSFRTSALFLALTAIPFAAGIARAGDETPPPPDGVGQLGDHYLCYNTKVPVSIDVLLKDQFGTFKFHAYAISRLCNPVAKTYKGATTEIRNPTLHYVCYLGKTETITRSVQINNQFGPAMLKVTGPTELCLPSVKKEIKG